MNYLKLALTLSPAIVAILGAVGIAVTEQQVSLWVNLVMIAAGLLGSVVPSLKAWSKYGEQAD